MERPRQAEAQRKPLRFRFIATVLSHIISFVDLNSNEWARWKMPKVILSLQQWFLFFYTLSLF